MVFAWCWEDWCSVEVLVERASVVVLHVELLVVVVRTALEIVLDEGVVIQMIVVVLE